MTTGMPCIPPENPRDTVSNISAKQKSPLYRDVIKSERWYEYNHFIDSIMRDLSNAEFRTWAILFRDARNDVATTGQSDIARRAGISTRAITQAIKRLLELGLIKIVKRGCLRSGPSTYRLVTHKSSLEER